MIEPYQTKDFACLVNFVAAIQEHERVAVPELKSGKEIGNSYAEYLLKMVDKNNGQILMAHIANEAVGVICAWVDKDEDQLLQDDAKDHAYISDIYVEENYRGKGVAQKLVEAIEIAMINKGCKRIRVCSKASNMQALNFYKATGFNAYEVSFSKSLEKPAQIGAMNPYTL